MPFPCRDACAHTLHDAGLVARHAFGPSADVTASRQKAYWSCRPARCDAAQGFFFAAKCLRAAESHSQIIPSKCNATIGDIRRAAARHFDSMLDGSSRAKVAMPIASFTFGFYTLHISSRNAHGKQSKQKGTCFFHQVIGNRVIDEFLRGEEDNISPAPHTLH